MVVSGNPDAALYCCVPVVFYSAITDRDVLLKLQTNEEEEDRHEGVADGPERGGHQLRVVDKDAADVANPDAVDPPAHTTGEEGRGELGCPDDGTRARRERIRELGVGGDEAKEGL
jgi:hypothetical protein